MSLSKLKNSRKVRDLFHLVIFMLILLLFAYYEANSKKQKMLPVAADNVQHASINPAS